MTRTAAESLARARLADTQRLELAGMAGAAGPLELLALLPAFEPGGDDSLARRLVEALGSARARASLRPEQVRATFRKYPEAGRAAAETLAASLDAEAADQAAHLERLLMELQPLTGDIRRGQAVFLGEKAACLACHRIGYQGGDVCPDLTRIG